MSDQHELPPGSVRRFERPQPLRYTIGDLEQESGVTARTIRYYISEGLLSPAYGRGTSATYDPEHLLRLKYIQLLKDERLPLGEIRERLNNLSAENIAAALDVSLEPGTETWSHIRLHEDVLVQIRQRQVSERDPRFEQSVALILEYARSVLDELRRPESFSNSEPPGDAEQYGA